MTIDKFRFGEGYTVEFSTFSEAFRIDTSDEPKAELFAAARQVVHQALILFGLDSIPASLACIEISTGEEPGTKVHLKVPTKTGDDAKIQCPKVSSREVRDYESGARADHPRNDFNDAVDEFIAQAEEYVRGKRQQMSLPFDGVSEADEPVVNGRMEQAVADRVTAFRR